MISSRFFITIVYLVVKHEFTARLRRFGEISFFFVDVDVDIGFGSAFRIRYLPAT